MMQIYSWHYCIVYFYIFKSIDAFSDDFFWEVDKFDLDCWRDKKP